MHAYSRGAQGWREEEGSTPQCLFLLSLCHSSGAEITLPQQSVSQPSHTGPASYRGKPLKELLSLTEHHSDRARLGEWH